MGRRVPGNEAKLISRGLQSSRLLLFLVLRITIVMVASASCFAIAGEG